MDTPEMLSFYSKHKIRVVMNSNIHMYLALYLSVTLDIPEIICLTY